MRRFGRNVPFVQESGNTSKHESMRGCPALIPKQLKLALVNLKGKYALRNRAMVTLGVRLGLRISELLSLEIGEVWDGKRVKCGAICNAHRGAGVDNRSGDRHHLQLFSGCPLLVSMSDTQRGSPKNHRATLSHNPGSSALGAGDGTRSLPAPYPAGT
jgi:hypothetical protein